MRLHTCLGTTLALGLGLALGVAGCSDSAKQPATAKEQMAAVAEALTTGVTFKNGMFKKGGIPEPDADNVKVDIGQDDPPLELEPGDEALMSLAVDNPDEDADPVVATLVQFDGSSDHVEVAADDLADAGTGSAPELTTSFTLSDTICKNFCNQEFPLVMVQALKLHGGGVSKHVTRQFTLDCRKAGDPTQCPKDDNSTKGSSGSSGNTKAKDAGSDAGDTSSNTPDLPSAALGSALVTFNHAKCVTCDKATGSTPNYCKTAPFSQDAVQCVDKAVDDNADTTGVTGWANCIAGQLKALTSMCSSACDDVTCGAAQFDAANAKCKALPADVQDAVDACMVSPGLDAGTDAGP